MKSSWEHYNADDDADDEEEKNTEDERNLYGITRPTNSKFIQQKQFSGHSFFSQCMCVWVHICMPLLAPYKRYQIKVRDLCAVFWAPNQKLFTALVAPL